MSNAVPRSLFIRACDPLTDAEAIIDICQQTVAADLQNEAGLSMAPYIWALPYVYFEAASCFVLDSGSGTAVGYIVGTPNTQVFVDRYQAEYIPKLPAYGYPEPSMDKPALGKEDLARTLLQTMYTPQALLHDGYPQLLKEYPAHLHIDILPVYQRQGYGRRLMTMFCETLRECGAIGVHLIIAGDNVRAERFYDRMGFGRFPVTLDGGPTGETGRDAEKSLWLVRKRELKALLCIVEIEIHNGQSFSVKLVLNLALPGRFPPI
ncbi:hypothetical protein MMC13_004003 [Lambiella insularis]|nr:hypothetical protein [Lambiella insularis]